jgi:hypothetical protein
MGLRKKKGKNLGWGCYAFHELALVATFLRAFGTRKESTNTITA